LFTRLETALIFIASAGNGSKISFPASPVSGLRLSKCHYLQASGDVPFREELKALVLDHAGKIAATRWR